MKFRFSPLESRGVLLGLSLGRLVALVTALALAVLAFRTSSLPLQIVLGVVVLLLVVLGLVRIGGRPLTAWLPVVLSYWLQRSTRQNVFRGGPFAPNGVENFMALPGPLASCQWLPARAHDGQREIGLIKDKQNGHVIAVLLCSGTNVILEDSSLQERRIGDWGDVMRTLGTDDDSLVRWQVLERTVPDGAGAAEAFIRNRMLPEKANTPAARSLQQLVEVSAPSALRHEVYLAVRFDLKRLAPQIKAAGSTDAAAAAVVVDALYSIERSVADAGVISHGWLPPRGLAAVLRSQYDPVDLPLLESRAVDADGVAPGVAPQLAGPVAAEAHWTFYQHDSGVSQTVWVHALPARDVGRHWLQPLLNQTNCRRSISLVAEPMSSQKAEALARRQMVQHQGDRETRRKLKLVESARVRKEANAVAQEDEEVASGFSRVRYSMFVTVTATDHDALARDISLVRRKLSKAGCESVVLFGEQDQAFMAGALPVAFGLAPMRGVL